MERPDLNPEICSDEASDLILDVEGHYPGKNFDVATGKYQITFDQPYTETTVNVASIRFADAADPEKLILHFADFTASGRIAIPFKPEEAAGKHPPLQKRNAVELYYVISGTVNGLLQNESFTLHEGDALVVNSNTKNAYYYSPGTETVFLTMSNHFFERFFPVRPDRASYHSAFKDLVLSNLSGDDYKDQDFLFFTLKRREAKDAALNLLKGIYGELSDKEPSYDIMTGILVQRLFKAFSDGNDYECRRGKYASLNSAQLASLVKEHLDKTKRKISLAELAEIFHYSERYINRSFKKEFGCSVRDYNTDIVMKEADYLLKHSGLTVAEIADRVGYSGRGQFYKVYESRYGGTPHPHR